MLRSPLRVRVVAPLALAALTLGMPSAALAETVPAPSPTASASAPASASPSPTETAAPNTPSTTATATPTPEVSTPATKPAAPTTTPAAPAAPAPEGKAVPFGADRSSARIAGTPSDQAGYAGGFMVRTLAEQGNHYTYPGSDFFDGGNTIDAILGLDGAKVGQDGADAAFAHLEDNLGSYIGTDFSSLYAGPTAKALLAVVAHGGDPTAFGGVDLVDELVNNSLGAVEPGRFSDLPVDCGFDTCDYSNTIGQSLAIIAVGRATGEVPGEAVDLLLDQQCADGGFRGTINPAGDACASDLDATAFAVQALVGLGADEAVDGLDYLASKQQSSGGFINGDGVVNTNSTAVAAQAFAAAGWTEELGAAQGFLAELQLDCTFTAGLRGGIAFSAADRATLLKTPGDQEAIDKMLRATPQSTLALAGGSLLDVTVEGTKASAPSVPCSTSPSPTGTSAPTPTETTPGTGTGSGTATPSATAPTGSNPSTTAPATAGPGLAYTGGSPVAPLTLAVLLLLAGAATILASRRRGARQ
ncbi:peptidase [Knoellia sinensis KCTC 19936]|uniref:Peptidase n=1 Tax=Knoellia sinensis KCTC 19936 TaxID=1385520 RepID=A0A0A0JGI5_9MICO|nr:prenyltransferase/squalene oxidase repeat-containing protein [Knoellia sinensis]KGN34731.1 peptidase [Knoellia sinensis KCTC 19936]